MELTQQERDFIENIIKKKKEKEQSRVLKRIMKKFKSTFEWYGKK